MSKVMLYTDGGVRGNQNENNIGSWGAYMIYRDYENRISGGERNTTNNIMELKGCIEGLKAIKNKNLPVVVHLDSAYVLNGITSWIESWKRNGWRTSTKKPVQNMALWRELEAERNKFFSIEFVKVKGHSDNEGNNIADKLCNDYMDKMMEE